MQPRVCKPINHCCLGFGPGAIEEYLMQATRATGPIPMCFPGRRREAFSSCGDVDAAAIINNNKVRHELQRDEPGWTWGTVPQSTCLLYYCKELLVQQCSHQIMIPWAIMSFGSGSSFYQLIGHGKGESRSSLITTIVNTFHHICNRILPFSFSL